MFSAELKTSTGQLNSKARRALLKLVEKNLPPFEAECEARRKVVNALIDMTNEMGGSNMKATTIFKIITETPAEELRESRDTILDLIRPLESKTERWQLLTELYKKTHRREATS